MSEFHLSCWRGDLEKVKEYLNDENIDEVNKVFEEKEDDQWIFIESRELTPLICAIENNHLNIVQYLFQQGANIHLAQ